MTTARHDMTTTRYRTTTLRYRMATVLYDTDDYTATWYDYSKIHLEQATTTT